MKALIFISLVVVVVAIGCLLLRDRTQGRKGSGPDRPPKNATKLSNGGFDWYLGNFSNNGTNLTINGTNIPAGQMRILVRPADGTNAEPGKSAVAQ